MTKVSFTCLSKSLGGGWIGGRADGFRFKLFHEQVGSYGANGGTNGCMIGLFKILTLEEEVGILEAKLQHGNYMSDKQGGPMGK